MRKKFTLLFASLLAFAGVAKAGVTDLPEMSTEGSIKYYTIKNTRSGKYANYAGDATNMTQVVTPGLSSLFYFTASDAETAEGFTPVMIHNAATTNKLEGFESWTEAGKAWFLSVDAQNATPAGLHIVKDAKFEGWNAFNDGGGATITYYLAKDAGSVFEISAVTDLTTVLNVPAAKATAKAALENLALVPVFATAATEAIAAVEAVEVEGTGLAELNAAIEEINAIVAASKKNSLEGKFFTLYTAGRNQYAKMTISGTAAAATATSPDFIWQFVENNGAYNIYNPYIDKYLGALGNVAGPSIAVTANQAEAGTYNIGVAVEEVKDGEGNATGEKNASLTFNVGDAYIHLNGSLLPWYGDGGASYWTVAEVSDFSQIVESYKTATNAILAGWDTLSVVFDSEKIEAAKKAIAAIDETGWASVEAVKAALETVADDAAEQYFTFSNDGAGSRKDQFLATNDTVGCGAKNFSYGAVWKLVPAVGGAFYLYNEVKDAYLGSPSSKAWLQKNIDKAAAYTFEIVEAAAGKVELKNGGQTLHLAGDGLLMDYDWNDSASRWIVTKMNLSDEITALLATIKPEDYAEVPVLGQYTKKAYDELVEAEATVGTIAEVVEVINNFVASKNLPVFTINGVIGYAAGKSIYDEPGKVNGKGNTHYFKTTDKSDKTMWWALDMTTTEVGVIESVGIRNVGTGANFWGCPTIKITETEENEGAGIADDGIFLFYTTDNNNPIHAQNDGQLICRYGDKGAASGSAWTFTYIGNTYDLNKESGESTDIEAPAVAEVETVIYDLLGRRVEKMEKGIYIVNGRKVLVK